MNAKDFPAPHWEVSVPTLMVHLIVSVTWVLAVMVSHVGTLMNVSTPPHVMKMLHVVILLGPSVASVIAVSAGTGFHARM